MPEESKKVKNKPVTIIVPIYADWDSLRTCLAALKEHVREKDTVLIVNDCGPEADILEKKIKKYITNRTNFQYFRNQYNLGFIKTCNRAVFDLDITNNDILLLNSDTEVTEGFLDEMIEVLYSEETIGATSPRSNNATIATIPFSTMKEKGIVPTKSFEIYKKIKNELPKYNEVPTTHGFCMLIKRMLIDKYGLFDEIFGKGYGEENDFCMRLMEHGYKSVLSNRAYVFHLEARSFSFEEKNKILEKNLKILYERHPQYRPMVRKYVEEASIREGKILQDRGVAVEPKTGIFSRIFKKR